jgi:hypothetical protein
MERNLLKVFHKIYDKHSIRKNLAFILFLFRGAETNCPHRSFIMTQKSSLILDLILMDILLIAGHPYKNVHKVEKGETPKETAKKIRQGLQMAKTKTTEKKRFFESLGSAY